MINELGHLNERQAITGLSEGQKAESSQIQNKEVLVALSKIQVGDVLSGKLIMENDQTVLKLESGLQLLAEAKNVVVSDQLLDFLVIGKERQHLELEQVQLGHTQSKNQVYEEAVLKEMQLPNTPEMKEIIGNWMNQQLPLIRNQLMQVYQIAKNYEMPLEPLMNISTQKGTLSEQESKLLAQFKTEGMEILDQAVKEIFKEATLEQAVKLNMSLGKYMALDNFKQEVANHIVKYSMNSSEDIYANLEPHQQAKVEVLMKQLEGKNVLELESMLESLPKESLEKLASRFIHKQLVIDQKEVLEKPEELMKMDETAHRLKEMIKDVQNHVGEDVARNTMQTLEQMANVIDKYNTQGQYYCFPLQLNEQQASGELYFFKPKKQKKDGQGQQGMYIVLALDMPSLKHIEVHLVEKNELLELRIKVANDEILTQMETNEHQLRALMDETMMPIGDIQVERLETQMEKKVPKKTEVLSRLDFRV